MTNVLAFFPFLRSLVQRLCIAVKHVVLDYAHPHPFSITIFPGGEATVDAALVNATLACTDLKNVVVLSAPPEERSGETCAFIRLKDEQNLKTDVTGAFAICRYLARLWRLNPTTPRSALIVDSALEHLSSFTNSLMDDPEPSNVSAKLRSFLEITNDELCDDSLYIGGMHSISLCDIMYRASIEHALTLLDKSFEEVFPEDDDNGLIHTWWGREDSDAVSLEEEENEGESNKEE